MREVSANAWEVKCDVLCITTNGSIRTDGSNPMGGGIAREAAVQNSLLPHLYGGMIQAFGHHVYLIGDLLMFPTKNQVYENASIIRISWSITETKVLADLYGWETIALPRPGAGLGGLDWHSQVKPAIEWDLDDRFLVVSYPGEK